MRWWLGGAENETYEETCTHALNGSTRREERRGRESKHERTKEVSSSFLSDPFHSSQSPAAMLNRIESVPGGPLHLQRPLDFEKSSEAGRRRGERGLHELARAQLRLPSFPFLPRGFSSRLEKPTGGEMVGDDLG